MTTATTNILSPRSSGDGVAYSSTKARHSSGISSPLAQIFRGAESEPVTTSEVTPSPSSSGAVSEQTPSSSPDLLASKLPAPAISPSLPAEEEEYSMSEAQHESSDINSNVAKKLTWGKPSYGNGNSTAVDVTPMMDTALCPALSDCTKASPKSASSDSLKALSDGSLPPALGCGFASSSLNKPLLANNANPSSTPNHVTPTCQRSMKSGGRGGISANGSFIRPSSLSQPQGPVVEMLPGKPGSTIREYWSNKDGGQRGGFGNDHRPQRSNSFNRRGSGGQHLHGDGSYHHNSYGGKRDQDRWDQDWNNSHRSFGSRDTHMQHQGVVPRGCARAPHTSPVFIPLPMPLRPFGNPMVYPEVPPSLIYVPGPPPDSLRGVPIMAQLPGHPLYFPPVPDPQLYYKIVNQINYYFSNENIVKDTFLRQNMDDQGWVPIKLIAGFKKVMLLTDNIQLILNAVQTSTVVEVQNDKVRKRNEWMKWIIRPDPFSSVSSPSSAAKSSHDILASQL